MNHTPAPTTGVLDDLVLVYDHGHPSNWPLRIATVGLTSVSGRGPAVVDSVAARSGTVSTYAGKSTWFELGTAT